MKIVDREYKTQRQARQHYKAGWKDSKEKSTYLALFLLVEIPLFTAFPKKIAKIPYPGCCLFFFNQSE
jgi:hypothetical protein